MYYKRKQKYVKKDIVESLHSDSSCTDSYSTDTSRPDTNMDCECQTKTQTKSVCDKLVLSKKWLKKNLKECKNVERKVKHKFVVKLGKCEVKKNTNYNHMITANVTHHVDEDINCHHQCNKIIKHKKTSKSINGSDCSNIPSDMSNYVNEYIEDNMNYNDSVQSKTTKSTDSSCDTSSNSSSNSSSDTSSCMSTQSSISHKKYKKPKKDSRTKKHKETRKHKETKKRNSCRRPKPILVTEDHGYKTPSFC
jgi:hypothetical protein